MTIVGLSTKEGASLVEWRIIHLRIITQSLGLKGRDTKSVGTQHIGQRQFQDSQDIAAEFILYKNRNVIDSLVETGLSDESRTPRQFQTPVVGKSSLLAHRHPHRHPGSLLDTIQSPAKAPK